ncbi:unnamed protein product [Protopolystoma xenopodis]|uniref:Uncharacterized protein n=1 Tax=Protopolystoma xenopodis TaxID=117903 RepID=A0A448X880_9PLAT|nr:unnamed protein product [Protopolystoma xenopodis]
MAALTDDADNDGGETFENVPSSRSDVGNYDNYYGRGIRKRCVYRVALTVSPSCENELNRFL